MADEGRDGRVAVVLHVERQTLQRAVSSSVNRRRNTRHKLASRVAPPRRPRLRRAERPETIAAREAAMSDIGLEFPPWVSLAFLAAQYWFVLAPALLALAGIGWLGRGLPIALRYAAWSGSRPVRGAVRAVARADRWRRCRDCAPGGGESLASCDPRRGGDRRRPVLTGRRRACVRRYGASYLSAVALPRPTPVAGILARGSARADRRPRMVRRAGAGPGDRRLALPGRRSAVHA